MAKIAKKSLPWFLILGLIVSVIFVISLPGSKIKADTEAPVTSVTVGNDAPAFTADPYEDPSSHSGAGTGGTAGNPTNMGEAVTFKATVSDANGDDVYLAICKNTGITAGASGAAPTCTGAGGAWVITSTAKAVGAITETYTITASETAQSYDWYGYVCDNNAGEAKCSSEAHAVDASGPPFYVNHGPTFTAVSDEAGNPGAADLTITAATTISGTDGYDDDDTNAAQDTVRLYVCKTAGFTAGATPGCTGDTWCSQITGKNPVTPEVLSCDLTVTNPTAHGEVAYYPYVVDNHGLAATGGKQGSTTETFTVNDVAPTISGAVTLNDAGTIDLTGSEKTTKDIYVKGTITDDNGCADIAAAQTYTDAWLTSLTRTGCDSAGEASGNNCYYHATCAYDATVEACGAMPDKTGGYKCTVSFQYYANPTDASTPWSATTWTATLIPGDGQGENAAGEVNTATAVEMQSFLALGLATGYTSIAYGPVAAGSNTGASLLEKTRVEATGNCGLDVNLSGTTMNTDPPGTAIAIANQKYGLGTTAPAWPGTALSGSATPVDLECCKSGYTPGTPAWKKIWWGIAIDASQAAGEYSGTNYIEAVKDGWSFADDWCELQ